MHDFADGAHLWCPLKVFNLEVHVACPFYAARPVHAVHVVDGRGRRAGSGQGMEARGWRDVIRDIAAEHGDLWKEPAVDACLRPQHSTAQHSMAHEEESRSDFQPARMISTDQLMVYLTVKASFCLLPPRHGVWAEGGNVLQEGLVLSDNCTKAHLQKKERAELDLIGRLYQAVSRWCGRLQLLLKAWLLGLSRPSITGPRYALNTPARATCRYLDN
eukprot:908379-Pelagomonas_calceolata.AAC.4